jgi:hypothetical protein
MNGLSGHSVPHHFHLAKASDGQVTIRSKSYSSSSAWSEPLVLLTEKPTGQPFTIPIRKLPPKITTQFNKHVKNLNNDLFTREQLDEWEYIFGWHAEAAAKPSSNSDNLIAGLTCNTDLSDSDSDPEESEPAPTLKIIHRRTTTTRFNFQVKQWVAVRPDQSTTSDPFWLGKLKAIQRTNIVVRWYVPDEQIDGKWIIGEHKHRIPHSSVLLAGFDFNPDTGLSFEVLKQLITAIEKF